VCRVDRRLAPPTAALTVTLTEATEVLASGGTATRQVHAQRADSDSAPLQPLHRSAARHRSGKWTLRA
jgi:hypothetical protein